MYKQLETHRLLIRPISIDDNQFIFKLMNSEGWLKYIGDRKIGDSLDAKNYIQKILDKSGYYYHVCELKETKEPFGIITFLKRESQEFPDLGFAILPEYQKKGYAYEASRRYLDEVLAESRVKEIMGITLPQNLSSINLLKKLGFTFSKNILDNNEEVSYYTLQVNKTES